MVSKERDEKTVPAERQWETSTRSAGLCLLVSSSSGVRVVALADTASSVLGRVPECDLPIADASVSRRHAVLHAREGNVVLEDLGSSNGTIVDDRRLDVGERVSLRIGATFELGSVTCVLQRAPALLTAGPSPSRTRVPVPARDAVNAPVVVDATMRRLYAMVDVIAASPLIVLVLGETGVGKQILAEEIHRRSPRANARFLQINCAALPATMLEAELFGFERGAFTGAINAKPGLFEAASGGTVFLDELGEVPLETQAKLLHVLESGQVMRLGSTRSIVVDVRFIAATNRDLAAMVAEQRFRADLFFRVDGVSITLPPLRKRPAEILPLAERFAEMAAAHTGRPPPAFTASAIAALERHPWPGNVRELKNAIERAVVLGGGAPLDAEHFVLDAPGRTSVAPTPTADLRGEVAALEHQRIVEALEKCGGNQTEAARMLNVPRRTLIGRIERFGIARPRKASH